MLKVLNEKKRVEEIIAEGGMYVEKHTTCSKVNCKSYEEFERASETSYFRGAGDLYLLARYFFGQGLKPAEVKEKVKELWLNYNSADGDYKQLNKVVDSVYRKKNYDLRDINVEDEGIFVHRGVVNYINGLDMSLDIKKMVFTLYCWTIIQKEYCPKNWKVVSLGYGSEAKLMKEAGVNKRFKTVQREFYKKTWERGDDIFKVQPASEEGSYKLFRRYLRRELWSEKMFDAWKKDMESGEYRCTDPAILRAEKNYNAKDPVYVDTDKFDETGELILIKDIHLLGQSFMDILGLKLDIDDPTKECPECGKRFLPKSHNPKECCEDCRKKKAAEKQRARRAKLKEEKNDVTL